MKELELKKPITAHGETLSVLEFDEPTGKDVRELGYQTTLRYVSKVKPSSNTNIQMVVT